MERDAKGHFIKKEVKAEQIEEKAEQEAAETEQVTEEPEADEIMPEPEEKEDNLIFAEKKVEELKERTGGEYGACRFCGQMKLVESDLPLNQEELNERATRACNCDGAIRYDAMCNQIEMAANRIEMLFGQEAEQIMGEHPIDPIIVENLKELSKLVAKDMIGAVTVYIGDGISAKITKGSKGIIKITRNKAEQKSLEA